MGKEEIPRLGGARNVFHARGSMILYQTEKIRTFDDAIRTTSSINVLTASAADPNNTVISAVVCTNKASVEIALAQMTQINSACLRLRSHGGEWLIAAKEPAARPHVPCSAASTPAPSRSTISSISAAFAI